jgi:hypothetical protein
MSTKKIDVITAEQCRAGRALVDMTQSELASRSKLGLSTIVDFEKRRRLVSADAIRAMRFALESAGVLFIQENGAGAGVRLTKRGIRSS